MQNIRKGNTPPQFKLSALMLALLSGYATAASNCSPGFYGPEGASGADCIPAPVGSYVPVAGATAAIEAPPGTFVGTIGQSATTQAPPGTFVEAAGQSVATPAPAGSYVPVAGATAATQAPPGTFVETEGQSVATPAPAGTYVPFAGATAFTEAPPGTFVVAAGQSAATPAPAGTFVSTYRATVATQAPPGTFVETEGQSVATPAPAGTFVSTYGATSAQTCNAGLFAKAGSVSCKASFERNVEVGPIFGSTYGTGGTVDLGDIDFNSLYEVDFDFFNLSNDLGVANDFSALTLFGYTQTGTNADWLELLDFNTNTRLYEGETLFNDLKINTNQAGSFDVTLSVQTDQSADFNSLGDIFSFRFMGEILAGNDTGDASLVPEPSFFALVLGGVLFSISIGRFKPRKKT